MKSPEDHARGLLRKARQDALVFQKIMDDSEISAETLGFHMEQALEKALKALIAARSIPFRKTHDIRELLDLIKDNRVELPNIFQSLDEWTPYAVEYRYEDADPVEADFDKGRAFGTLQDVLSWVESDIDLHAKSGRNLQAHR